MIIIESGFEGLFVLEPQVFSDERGYFFESFRLDYLREKGINSQFLQDNEALSQKNTFRGFHYQLEPFGQAKLVRVITGSVLDIVIDIRPDSDMYGKVFQMILSGENKKQMLVPRGFAHGYLCLEDNTIFSYKVDGYYNKEFERGISFQDNDLDIEWPSDPANFIVSEKDKMQPTLGNHEPYVTK